MASEVPNDHAEQLKKLAEEVGMDISHDTNGQRSLGPPKSWTGEVPPRGSEIHVGRIPRHVTESTLYPLFRKCGEIYTFRLMMSFGENRGYCFVKYATIEDANNAIKEMDGYQIENGKPLRVQRSVENQKLFIRPIPANATVPSVYQELQRQITGIMRVTVHANTKNVDEQYAFLEFADHKSAAIARKRILEHKALFEGSTMYVDWALPAENKNLPRTLRIRNANPTTDEDDLKRLLNKLGNGGLLTFAVKKKYLQAQFDTHENAQQVINKLNGSIVDGCALIVNWKRGNRQRLAGASQFSPNMWTNAMVNEMVPPMMTVPVFQQPILYHQDSLHQAQSPFLPMVQIMHAGTNSGGPMMTAVSHPAPTGHVDPSSGQLLSLPPVLQQGVLMSSPESASHSVLPQSSIYVQPQGYEQSASYPVPQLQQRQIIFGQPVLVNNVAHMVDRNGQMTFN